MRYSWLGEGMMGVKETGTFIVVVIRWRWGGMGSGRRGEVWGGITVGEKYRVIGIRGEREWPGQWRGGVGAVDRCGGAGAGGLGGDILVLRRGRMAEQGEGRREERQW